MRKNEPLVVTFTVPIIVVFNDVDPFIDRLSSILIVTKVVGVGGNNKIIK